MGKNGTKVVDYMRSYMYVGIPDSVLSFMCRGIVTVLGGEVGPKVIRRNLARSPWHTMEAYHGTFTLH